MGNSNCSLEDHADCSNNSVCGSRGKITQLLTSTPKEEGSISSLQKARLRSMMSPRGEDLVGEHFSESVDGIIRPEHRFHSQASPFGDDDKENRENFVVQKQKSKKPSSVSHCSPQILDHCDNCSLCIPSQPQTARTVYEEVPTHQRQPTNIRKEKLSRAPLGKPPAHPFENAPNATIAEAGLDWPRRGRNPTTRPPMVPPLPSTKALQDLQGGSTSRPLSPAQSSQRRRNRSRGSSTENRGGLSEREFGAKMRVLSLRRELGFDQEEKALAL